MHAISAAGVMYTLIKNCSMGDFDNCGCDDSKIGKMGKTLFINMNYTYLQLKLFNAFRPITLDCSLLSKVVVVGFGEAAVTMLTLEKESLKNSWTRWKMATTLALQSTCTTTKLVDL